MNNNTKIFATVSLLFDISGGIVVTILPLYLLSIGLEVWQIGLIEGIGLISLELLRLISAYLAEISGKRKIFVELGYSLAAITKPLFALTNNFYILALIRAIDRGAKGIRDSARDAMVAYDEKNTGKAFGFLKMFDNIGALIGPILALLLIDYGINYQQIFFVSFLPALLGAMLTSASKEKTKHIQKIEKRWFENKTLLFVGIIFIYSLAIFSDSFLLIYGLDLGRQGSMLLYISFGILYILASYSVGYLYDLLKEMVLYIGLSALALSGIAGAMNTPYLFIIFFAIAKAVLFVVPRAHLKEISKHYLAYDALTFTAIGFGMAIANIITGYLWELNIMDFRMNFVYMLIIAILSSIVLLLEKAF